MFKRFIRFIAAKLDDAKCFLKQWHINEAGNTYTHYSLWTISPHAWRTKTSFLCIDKSQYAFHILCLKNNYGNDKNIYPMGSAQDQRFLSGANRRSRLPQICAEVSDVASRQGTKPLPLCSSTQHFLTSRVHSAQSCWVPFKPRLTNLQKRETDALVAKTSSNRNQWRNPT